MKEEIKLDVAEIIGRLKMVYRVRTDIQLATVMGIQRENVANWRRRKTVPVEILARAHDERAVDLNWLMFAQESLEQHWRYPVPLSSMSSGAVPGIVLAWDEGMNNAQAGAEKEYGIVVQRGPRGGNPHISLTAPDGSMSPGIERGDDVIVEVFPAVPPVSFDYSALIDQILAVYDSSSSIAHPSTLFLRRFLRAGSGYALYSDAPPSPPEPYLVNGKLQNWKILGVARAVLKILPAE